MPHYNYKALKVIVCIFNGRKPFHPITSPVFLADSMPTTILNVCADLLLDVTKHV